MGIFTTLHQANDLALLLLRFVLAAIFFAHGSMKWKFWKMSPNANLPGPLLKVLRLLSIMEPLGALAALMGLGTQVAALGFCLVMCGAINVKKSMGVNFASDEKVGWEFDLALLASSFVLLTHGAGGLSLDAILLNF